MKSFPQKHILFYSTFELKSKYMLIIQFNIEKRMKHFQSGEILFFLIKNFMRLKAIVLELSMKILFEMMKLRREFVQLYLRSKALF